MNKQTCPHCGSTNTVTSASPPFILSDPGPLATLPFWKKMKLLLTGRLDEEKPLPGMPLKNIYCRDCGKSAVANVL